MILDVLISLWIGWMTSSFGVFFGLVLLAALFGHHDWTARSGLARLALVAIGMWAFSSLFGGDCDGDL